MTTFLKRRTLNGAPAVPASPRRVAPMRTEIVRSVEPLDVATWVRSYVAQVMTLADDDRRAA